MKKSGGHCFFPCAWNACSNRILIAVAGEGSAFRQDLAWIAPESDREHGGGETMLRDLKRIPGVGKKIGQVLWDLGFRSVADLKDQDPEELYAKLCAQKGGRVDRCVLYVFRCAVYFASNEKHDPARLKWWAWKDA